MREFGRQDMDHDINSLSDNTWPVEPFLELEIIEQSQDLDIQTDKNKHRASFE